MFWKKKAKETIDEAKKQYEELLKENGYSVEKSGGGFILGEKKEIYNSDMSLEDIINGNQY